MPPRQPVNQCYPVSTLPPSVANLADKNITTRKVVRYMAYDAKQFSVLRGLEPVRARPGMYTRTDNPTHIVLEVVDNAADEALAGHATKIHVSVSSDGWIRVTDNGRGIPVGIPPNETRPAVELAFSTLHAGSKFHKGNDADAYRFSGGLHGVGIAVTNALSKEVRVRVTTLLPNARSRYGVYTLAFINGDLSSPLTQIDTADPSARGTIIEVLPDGKYFDSPMASFTELSTNLRSKALLLPGLQITLEYAGHDSITWEYPAGLSGYLESRIAASGAEIIGDKVYTDELFYDGHAEFSNGEGASWALAWTDGSGSGESFVNLIPTPAGGTHESGFRAGIFDAITHFINHYGLMPAKLKITQDDALAGVVYVLSAKVLDPQFQGQTKEKLTNRSAHKLVSAAVCDLVELWLNSNPDAGKAIAERVIEAATTRTRSAQRIEKRKTSGLATLPGTLTDCQSEDISLNEIFIVEGNSACGTVKAGRDKDTQAILPLRGKILNTWEVSRDNLFANTEIHNIAVALGINPHSLEGSTPSELDKLRYGKVIILSDADVDGSHIQVLLITLFVAHFPQLVLEGHLFVAQPPLFRLDITTRGQVRKIYVQDEAERDTVVARFLEEGVREDKIQVQRFKGLGEMNADQLFDTALCPDTRTLVPITFNRDEYVEIRDGLDVLMSKQVGPRRALIERYGATAVLDV